MNISWITLRDLEYLTAVADLQHFGQAANRCHVSQPALSMQIRKIEDVLAVKLFERSNRKVLITVAGQAIAAQARVVLEEARKIGELAQPVRNPLQGTLRVGVIATLGPYLLPRILGPLRRRYPLLELLLKEGLTEPLIAELRAGTLDAVLAAPTFKTAGLRSIPLFWEPFLLAVPRRHTLRNKRPLRVSDLNPEEMVLLEDGHCLRDQTMDLCAPSGRTRVRAFHATSLETLRHLVATGFGYSLIPKLAATPGPLDNLIDYRPFRDQRVGRSVVLVCRDRFSRMPEVDALADFIRTRVQRIVTVDGQSGRTMPDC